MVASNEQGGRKVTNVSLGYFDESNPVQIRRINVEYGPTGDFTFFDANEDGDIILSLVSKDLDPMYGEKATAVAYTPGYGTTYLLRQVSMWEIGRLCAVLVERGVSFRVLGVDFSFPGI